jgi:hypothetical protein
MREVVKKMPWEKTPYLKIEKIFSFSFSVHQIT